MAFEPGGETYEEQPYAELTYQQTHPDMLAPIGALLGLVPAPVPTARVLELGCASGANIIAMAEVLPHAEFVGVDFSERQIEEGRGALRELGFANVSLLQGDIRDLAALDLGSFDYILAHGVYSWVPAEVRDALLAGIRSLLNPEGIAFVSYNALPGWSAMRSLREAMFYRTRDAASQTQRAEDAEAFYRLLQRANPPASSSYGHFLAEYEAHVDGRHQLGSDRAASLLLHDELADVNEPVYFHQFAEHAASHGLQYLADADFPSVFSSRLAPAIQAELRQLGKTTIEHQQYLDLLTNATFKQTLLCHAERTLSRRLGDDPAPLRGMFASSSAKPATVGPNRQVQNFVGSDGARLAIESPVGKAAMAILIERFPDRVAFPALVGEAMERVGSAAPAYDDAEAQAAAILLQGFCYSYSLVELRTTPAAYALKPGDRPRTPAVARRQVAGGYTAVTNLRHERVNVDALHSRLITLFDGTRTRAEALAEVDEGSNRSAKRFERAVETLTEMGLFLP